MELRRSSSAVEAGRIAPSRPSEPSSPIILFGAICEIAMVTARAADPEAALAEATSELGRLLGALTVTHPLGRVTRSRTRPANGICPTRQTCRSSKGPRVDRAAVANELEHPWLCELRGGPLVETLQSRHDHRVVEQPAETPLVGDIALDLIGERIVVRDHAPGQKGAPPRKKSPSRG